MKLFLILLVSLSVLVNANDLEKVEFDDDNFNLLCINPLISEKNKKSKVYKSIGKGYERQVVGLTYKIQKFNAISYKHYKKKKYKIRADKEAGIEFVEMLKVVNDYYERNDKDKVEPVAKTDDDEMSLDEDMDFSESDISELTEKGEETIDKYKESFVNVMDMMPSIYKLPKTDDGLWQIPYQQPEGIENIIPNVFFGEYFNPSKQGRRYFLSINIFIFIIDSDGDARVMVQEISDYNWKRNYRFITAQSGKALQDTIAKMTGLDIR